MISKCRGCGGNMLKPALDLGFSPPSNAYLMENDMSKPEIHFPLRLVVCEECWLLQTEDYCDAEALFTDDYAYFSSTSKTWLAHAEIFANDIIDELSLDEKSFVLELASNDGYLLENFVKKNIPNLGVEPCKEVALASKAKGVNVLVDFFSEKLSKTIRKDKGPADLVVGNNVFAHVPDIVDFAAGIENILKPNGTVSLEFPHIKSLLEFGQFDTIYHEHFSYLSLIAVSQIFSRVGLRIYSVEKLHTHGGSLRILGCKKDSDISERPSVGEILAEEYEFGLDKKETYFKLQQSAEAAKLSLWNFLLDQKKQNKTVVGFGAAAKGNTLLNFAGISSDLIEMVGDSNPAKQQMFMPGSHIPIVSPETIIKADPDVIIILPWNLGEEIVEMFTTRLQRSDTKFVSFMPTMKEV